MSPTALRGDRHDGAGVQIHCLLGLVSQVRRAILHLGHFRVPVMRVYPLFVGSLLLPPAIHAPHRGVIASVDARLLGQPSQIFHVALAAVPPHDRAHRRVGFQRGRVDANRFALQHSAPRYLRQHEGEHSLVRRFIQQPPRPRDRHVIRRGFVPPVLQKPPQTQAVGHAPANAALAGDSFKEANQQQPEVHARRQRRPPQLPVVEPAAVFLAKRVKPRLIQNPIQLLVERMPRRFGPLARVKQLFLLLSGLLRPHRHA